MILSIKQDHNRFRDIVKGKIRGNFKKYITQGEMIGKREKEFVSIPLPSIEIPNFRYGPKNSGGVGQGEGDPGQPMDGEPQPGAGEAGNSPGEHLTEVELTFQELAEILGEELQLPKIQPRGHKQIKSLKTKYSGMNRVGPDSLRHFKSTYKEALKRQIIAGTYDAEDPIIIPVKKDMRYRTFKLSEKPESNAVILYMMDVSGSMGDEQKEIVRLETFWINTWLKSQYKELETRFIIHDAAAKEVDEETFFRTRESGGTLISSAYTLAQKIIEEEYPSSEWNIYPFHFSDGDNWSGEDTRFCVELMKDKILPVANVFCYGQVESKYGSGQFIKDLEKEFTEDERVITSRIDNREAIYGSIKDFLGKGK
jgi:sporulation protein YhbH